MPNGNVMNAPGWYEDAACQDTDPEAFFPDQSQQPFMAIALCNTCPVMAQCREAGMDERFGVWGGLTENDRRRIRSKRRMEMQA